jgi:hypothetical protein
MFQQEVKFQILEENVSSVEDVFDNLVRARNVLTREEGYLLCSHYSKWPAEKINQATWLAGCFTPVEHRKRENLVFGVPNPDHVINWFIDPEDRSIRLKCGGVSSATRNALGIQLEEEEWPPQFKDAPPLTERKIKAIKRLLFGRNSTVSTYNIMKSVIRYLTNFTRFYEGECFYVQEVLYPHLSIWDLQESAEQEGIYLTQCLNDYHMTTPEGVEFTYEVYPKFKRIFNGAEDLPYEYRQAFYDAELTVVRNIPELGWVCAVQLPYRCTKEYVGKRGWWSTLIPTLTVCQNIDGFAKAQRIPSND